jgi:hypothetical protein
MSVEEGAFMLNSAGGVPFPGTWAVVLAKWKLDMVVVRVEEMVIVYDVCCIYYMEIYLVFEEKEGKAG